MTHLLHAGTLALLADPFAIFRVFSGASSPPRCLTPSTASVLSALSVDAALGEFQCRLFQAGPGSLPGSIVEWGVGRACYRERLQPAPGAAATVSFSLELVALPSKDACAVLLEVVLEDGASQSLSLTVTSDFGASSAPGFVKDSIAILPEVDAAAGDAFLAGGPEWSAWERATSIGLTSNPTLVAGEPFRACLIFGLSRTCSLDWIRSLWREITPESLRGVWSEALLTQRLRPPELWMHEEVLWSAGRFLSFTGIDGESPVEAWLQPGAVEPDGAPAQQRHDPVDTLLLAIPLQQRFPSLAWRLLRQCAAAQAVSGALHHCDAHVDPRCTRSHREIVFLVTCAYILQENPESREWLDREIPFLGGEPGTLWVHIAHAVEWVRDSIGSGAHGLIRMLAADLNPMLDRVGCGGGGESVLNSAMTVYALHALVDWARRRGEDRLADHWAAWHRDLRAAVSDAYGNRAFIRAYCDAGQAVGDGRDTVFAEVQAWAVLARCGSPAQRQEALDTLLLAAGEFPLPVLTVPYQGPDSRVSSWRVAPGDCWNGGFSPVVAAWVVWALAAERRLHEARHEWEKASIRQRSAAPGAPPVPILTNAAWTASCHAGRRSGAPPLGHRLARAACPDARAVAWNDFALHRVLRE